eukprot:8255913-Lingulodinium_polyedra.AAC.1
MPKELDLAKARACLPVVKSGKQPNLYWSGHDNRVRAYYFVQGVVSTSSASTELYGLSDALAWCLQWAWSRHVAAGGDLVFTKGCWTRSLPSVLWCCSIGHVQQLWLQTLESMCATVTA